MLAHLVSLVLLLPAIASAVELHGRVVGVKDGDTVVLLDATHVSHTIRLSGIDAPESHQPFGQKSKAALAAMVFDLQVAADCTKKDRYGRDICKISVGGVDANLEQIKAGMAWWYREYAREQSAADRTAYEQAEFWAKARRLGLWSDMNPVPPWEWRRGK